MSVYKRRGIWYYHIEVSGHPDSPVRRSAKTKNKKLAEEIETKTRARMLDDIHSSMAGRAPKRKFGEALNKWLTGEAKLLKSYNNIIDKACLIQPFLNEEWLQNVPEKAEEMKLVFIREGKAPATINRRLAIVKRVLNLAHRWGWLDSPIASKITLLSENNERHIYLHPIRILRLAIHAGKINKQGQNAILYLAFTGLRKSEMLGLTPVNKVNNAIYLDAKTKGSKPRIVPLPDIVKDIPLPIKITEHQLRRVFEKARALIGMPELHLHDLRHSYASLIVRRTQNLTAVRDVLGHAHIGVTSRYTHLIDDDIKQVIHSTFATQSGNNRNVKKAN